MITIFENKGFFLDRELFVKDNNTNELYGVGDTMKRTKLARTLEIIAKEGDDAFYTGELSDTIVKEIQDRGELTLLIMFEMTHFATTRWYHYQTRPG